MTFDAVLTNSIVLGNHGSLDANIQRSLTTNGGNIIGTNVFQGSSVVGTTNAAAVFAAIDPVTGGGLLSNIGGVPLVPLLRSAANPALDAGLNSLAWVGDARGHIRVDLPSVTHNGANVSDLGAFEVSNGAPVVLGTATVNEFAADGTVVGTLTADDADISLFTYTIVSGQNAGGRFAIGGVNNNQIVVADGLLLDYEQGTSHTIRVKVDDGLGGTFEQDLVVTVADVNPETVVGDGRDNVFFGGALGDTLDGGAGADTLRGGAGDDTYVVDNVGDAVIEAKDSGYDTINSSVTYSLVGRYVEKLVLTGSDNIDATGNSLNNTIIGNSGNNVINGGTGKDSLEGGLGNDTYFINGADVVIEANNAGFDTVNSSVSFSLAGQYIEKLVQTGSANIWAKGNSLNNIIEGNSGDNRLNGDRGNDTLTGGAGSDTFVFKSALNGATNVDTITDFTVGTDTIELARSVFSALSTGALDSDAFQVGSAAVDASDRIIYDSATGDLFYDADGSGAGAAVRFATLSTGLTLTASDFVIA